MRPQLIAVQEELMQPPPQGNLVQVGQVEVKTMHQRIFLIKQYIVFNAIQSCDMKCYSPDLRFLVWPWQGRRLEAEDPAQGHNPDLSL